MIVFDLDISGAASRPYRGLRSAISDSSISISDDIRSVADGNHY
ncbi:hypothetical protein [Actinomadura sp. HBU206391]|nr:hypothetical protein [Actinomadura sp. HBU206391]